MTTTSYNMYMKFIEDNKINTTSYTDNEKTLMTIIEQAFVDHDETKEELDETKEELDETKEELEEKDKENIELQEELEEKDKELEELKEEIDGDTFWGVNIGLKKENSNLITQQKRMVKEIAKLKKANELNSNVPKNP